MKKILLPIDGSEECMASYRMAEDFFHKYGSEITVLYINQVIPPNLNYAITLNPNYNISNTNSTIDTEGKKLSFSDSILKKAEDWFAEKDVHVISKSTDGDPASSIIDIAESESFDMIIMCTHGMSASKRFLLGSVTSKVVHYSKTPVLVMR
ncbi:MAG: universal stress protein [Peptostreptococcaceae bacterium]|nr:universal stress protein [Peptostreptococcaceae bacterium]